MNNGKIESSPADKHAQPGGTKVLEGWQQVGGASGQLRHIPTSENNQPNLEKY